MLNVFPKKSLCLVILFASTALTACGGGGGSSSSGFTVTTDTKSGTLPQIRPFVPDPTVPGFDASATEYVDTPTLRSMGLTPFYATGLSGSGISVGVLDSGIALVTVKHHLKSLRGKLGAKNRTHAVCRAIELGLTQEASES
jgi:hypothetical protein